MDKYEGHTPGPWEPCLDMVITHEAAQAHGRDDYESLRTSLPNRGWMICRMSGPDSVANQLLVADAPKLLAQRDRLLKVLKMYVENQCCHTEFVIQAHDAIKECEE